MNEPDPRQERWRMPDGSSDRRRHRDSFSSTRTRIPETEYHLSLVLNNGLTMASILSAGNVLVRRCSFVSPGGGGPAPFPSFHTLFITLLGWPKMRRRLDMNHI